MGRRSVRTMLALDDTREIVPSEYAKAAKAAGLDLIGWSLERDGDTLTVLDVLAKRVGVRGMFSDWPTEL